MDLDGKRSTVLVKTPLPPNSAVGATEFLDTKIGWVVVSSGNCQKSKQDCRQEGRLLMTSDGGNTFTEITPQIESTLPTVAASTPDAAALLATLLRTAR